MESARHLWHICYHCVECRFWASAFFQTKKNPRSAGREIQMKPEFLSTLHQATQREIPSTSSQIGRTFQAHQKTFAPCQKFPKCTDCYQKLETVSIKNYEKSRGTKLILHCHIVLKKAPNGVWTTIRLFEKVVTLQETGSMLKNCTETGKKDRHQRLQKRHFLEASHPNARIITSQETANNRVSRL